MSEWHVEGRPVIAPAGQVLGLPRYQYPGVPVVLTPNEVLAPRPGHPPAQPGAPGVGMAVASNICTPNSPNYVMGPNGYGVCVPFEDTPGAYRTGTLAPFPQAVLSALHVTCRQYPGIDSTLRGQALTEYLRQRSGGNAVAVADVQSLDAAILAYCRARVVALPNAASYYPYGVKAAGQVVADSYPNIGVSLVGLAIAFGITFAGAYYGAKAARKSR